MNNQYEKALGENLRKLRIAKNMTQEQVAIGLQLNGCDMTRSAYAKIEVAQRHLYADELVILQKVLHVSFEELLCFHEN